MTILELLNLLPKELHDDALVVWGKAKSWLVLANAMLPADAEELKVDIANLFLHTVIKISKKANLDTKGTRGTILKFAQKTFELNGWKPAWWDASLVLLPS
jgi:hypothetical protein